MDAYVTMVSTDAQITKMILNEFRDKLNQVFTSAAPIIHDFLTSEVRAVIEASPEYRSILTGGELAGILGLPAAERADMLEGVVDILMEQVEVKPKRVVVSGNKTLKGGIDINIIEANMIKAVKSQYASFITENGDVIPWLKWLVEVGHKTIFRSYDVAFVGSEKSRSETGAIMRPSRQGFNIPTEWAGDKEYNFVTRSLDNLAVYMETAIITIIENQI